jgi:hypothetical protein
VVAGWAIFRQRMPEGWRYAVEFSMGLMENRRAWALFPNDIRLRDIDE